MFVINRTVEIIVHKPKRYEHLHVLQRLIFNFLRRIIYANYFKLLCNLPHYYIMEKNRSSPSTKNTWRKKTQFPRTVKNSITIMMLSTV